jgi:hypothetical protein
MKKCSPPLAIKKMQIKTTLRFPVRIAIIKNTTNNKYWRRCGGKKGTHNTVGGNVSSKVLWKTIWRLLKKLSIDLPYDPAIPLLGIYPKECNSGYSIGTCTPMLVTALFTVAKLWKQPRCPTTDKWIKKMWYLYTMEFYSLMKNNDILSFASKWVELEHHLKWS